MKLTVLGSGKSNVGRVFRNTAAHLIEAGATKILLDCSDGTRNQLAALGLSSFDIDAVFFSHFHPDHFSPNCFLQDYVVRNFGNPDEELRLLMVGPKGLRERLVKSWDAAWGAGKFEDILMNKVSLEIRELADGESVQVEQIKVTGNTVKHSDMQALAYRIEGDRKVLAYSGDSSDCIGLERAAKDVDLFLCEAAIPPTGPKTDGIHVSSAGAAEVAKRAASNTLVLTHYSSEPEEMIESTKDTGFQGSVFVAKDLSNYEV